MISYLGTEGCWGAVLLDVTLADEWCKKPELKPMFHLEGRDVRARDRVGVEAGDSVRKELWPLIRLVFSQSICGHVLNTFRFE